MCDFQGYRGHGTGGRPGVAGLIVLLLAAFLLALGLPLHKAQRLTASNTATKHTIPNAEK